MSTLKSKADALYSQSREMNQQETVLARSAGQKWTKFTSSGTGIVVFFIAGILKDRLLDEPKQYAKAKSNRLVRMTIVNWIKGVLST